MKTESIDRAVAALDLKRNIIGVGLIDFKDDFDKLDLLESPKSGPLCYIFREAMEGKVFKITTQDISCDYAQYALGLAKTDKLIAEGRSYHHCGLYESRTISKEIVSAMKYLRQDTYGLVIGPLKKMEFADIIIIVDYAQTVMRIMQGYAYKYGSPNNLNFFGNQAACGDLVSKPYSTNDINFSLMCRGMRRNGRFDKGEVGVAIPIDKFDGLVDGIISTINPVSNSREKQEIMGRLDEGKLGIRIDMNYNYGIGLKEYDQKLEEKKNK